MLDEQTKDARASKPSNTGSGWDASGAFPIENAQPARHDDNGGASRFFYCAKTSKKEREAGLLGVIPCVKCGGLDTTEHTIDGKASACARNNHPTVKPLELMRYLIRLVCPPEGVVLDPFLGSGTTGAAAALEPCVGEFIGCELEEDSARIAAARIRHWQQEAGHEPSVEVIEAVADTTSEDDPARAAA